MDAAALREWQRRRRYPNKLAAHLLGLSESSFCRQKSGRATVSRQTELLTEYVELFHIHWLSLGEVARLLAKLAVPGR